jgi:hypothetical protein
MIHRISRLLKIQDEQKNIIEAMIEYFIERVNPDRWTLEFTSPIAEKLSFTEGDLFECLTKLRLELAQNGYKPLCNGARLNVYVSGMERDMGDGLSAHVITSESTLDIKDVEFVDIFDYAEPDLIASVEEQFKYYASQFDSTYDLKIQHCDNGYIVEGEIYENYVLEPHKMNFRSSVTPNIELISDNDFECLKKLQIELEKYNYRPLCNGARFDTYTLPTDIEMSKGNLLHVLIPGTVPTQDDRVYTFDYAEPNLIVSTGQQISNYQAWLDSIKSIPISEYDIYEFSRYYHLHFRLIKIGNLPLNYLFDIDNNCQDSKKLERLRALSPLSIEQVEQIGSLKGEAILGFIAGDILSLKYFSPNKVFKDFIQKVIATEAPKDSELQAVALKKREGRLYIIDNRVADLEREETSLEDILGTFEIKEGLIIANSYQPNENYLIFGNNGLMQLPASLHEALINALLSGASTFGRFS